MFIIKSKFKKNAAPKNEAGCRENSFLFLMAWLFGSFLWNARPKRCSDTVIMTIFWSIKCHLGGGPLEKWRRVVGIFSTWFFWGWWGGGSHPFLNLQMVCPYVYVNRVSNAEERRLFKAYPYLASLTLPCRKVHQFKNVLFCTAERGQGFPRGRSKRVFSVMRDLSDIIGWAVLTVFP